LKLTQPAEKLVAESEDAYFVKCDVCNWKDLQNLITFSEEKFGTAPDVYVPNAGIYEPVLPPFLNTALKTSM
jgi:NADP-dependent 3-hydroxy acid dehydrogenase YdfG